MAAHPDINVLVEIVGRDRPAVLAVRLAAGNPPDVTPIPWLGLMAEWARAGHLVPMDGLVDVTEQVDALTPLGYVDGKLYGVWQSANIKSVVWYNVPAFAAKGYEVPTAWDELIALSDRIATDGEVPWAIGLESGGGIRLAGHRLDRGYNVAHRRTGALRQVGQSRDPLDSSRCRAGV
ncbi:extracellular solute-binding protein [Dehalococcoidia bacterium]|nr:extracellular solute-binding protein [Dehalococcoidia bacterium]